jgi:peptide-methionine (R)-S-oxide reductase
MFNRVTTFSKPRRHFLEKLLGFIALISLIWSGFTTRRSANAESLLPATDFKVKKSPTEWHNTLTPEQYAVLRDHDTEPPHSSPLTHENRKGIFYCAGCNNDLFDAATKFESGTGWPSFYQPLVGAIGTQDDSSWFMTRIEVHCADCGGHLGHVFDDGPEPTGKRYCMNGLAMTFKPSAT